MTTATAKAVAVKTAKKTEVKKQIIKSTSQSVEIKNNALIFESDVIMKGSEKISSKSVSFTMNEIKTKFYSVLRMTLAQQKKYITTQELTVKDEKNYRPAILFSMFRERIESVINPLAKLKRGSYFNPIVNEVASFYKDEKIEALKFHYGKEKK